MIRDVKIEGQFGRQVKDFVGEDKMFSSNADLYFLSALIGMYESQYYDQAIQVDENVAHVSSRTWLRNRTGFEELLPIFLKLEKKLHGEPFNINEILLNNLEYDEEFEKLLNNNLKNYAYYGIDKLYNIFNGEDIVDSHDVINKIEKDLKKVEEIDLEVLKKDFKATEDTTFEEIIDKDIF